MGKSSMSCFRPSTLAILQRVEYANRGWAGLPCKVKKAYIHDWRSGKEGLSQWKGDRFQYCRIAAEHNCRYRVTDNENSRVFRNVNNWIYAPKKAYIHFVLMRRKLTIKFEFDDCNVIRITSSNENQPSRVRNLGSSLNKRSPDSCRWIYAFLTLHGRAKVSSEMLGRRSCKLQADKETRSQNLEAEA